MRQLLSLILILTAALARAQEWSGGVRLEAPLTIDRSGTLFTLGLTDFNMTDGVESSKLRPGLFVRYDQPRWLAQADVQHAAFDLGFRTTAGRVGNSITIAKSTQTTLRLTGGYKPAPWLRLVAGLGANYTNWQPQQYTNSWSTDAAERLYYQNIATVITAYKPWQLTGQLGLGIDLGGLTIDLARQQGLTPVLDGAPGAIGQAQANYGYTSLSVGYRIFPVKRFLATKRNRAYQKLKADIPYYRNEFHLGLGNQAEDINAGTIYEARYTRYFARRFGLVNSLSFSRRDAGRFSTYLTPTNGIVLGVMGRFLPIYTRRHQVGLSLGMQGAWQAPRLIGSFGQASTTSGQPVYRYVDAQPARFKLDGQWQFDYQIAITDRLPIGLWLRQGGYGAFYGFQFGYRF
jgi:hypothetical protein